MKASLPKFFNDRMQTHKFPYTHPLSKIEIRIKKKLMSQTVDNLCGKKDSRAITWIECPPRQVYNLTISHPQAMLHP